MNKMKRPAFLLFAVSIFLLYGCQPEEQSINSLDSPKVMVSIPLQVSSPGLVADNQETTRSVDAVSYKDMDFRLQTPLSSATIRTRAVLQFSNTWVLAFAADGTCRTCTNVGSISPDVPLSLELPQEADLTLYILCNGPSTLPSPGNLGAFESNAYFSLPVYTDETILPYIGKTAGVTVRADGRLLSADGRDVQIPLKRISAKLSLTCSVSVPDYRIASVKLHNAPPKMYYAYANAGGEISADALEANVVSGNTYTWFTGENLRGNGSSTDQYQRYAANAPASSTFIRVTLQSTVGVETVAYDIYPGKDLGGNYDLSRNWDYIYATTFTKSGSQLSSDRRVSVTGTPIDLTSVPSNCYILAPGQSYRIDPRIKGEGQNETGGVPDISITHTVDRVSLFWQDTPSLVQSVGLTSDAQSAVISLTPTLEGNALIAGYKSGHIMWTWHLWVRSKPLNWYTTNEISSMSCNLGALNGINEDSSGPNSLGLLYQWGRMTPFPGANAINANAIKPVYDINNNIVTITVFEGPQLVEVGIEYPFKFFYTQKSSGFSWHRDGDDLWGGNSQTKTIFDPCPRGWRVPVDHTVWEDWTADITSPARFVWDDANPSRTSHRGGDVRGLFPAAGAYDAYSGNNDVPPTLFSVSSAGMYWCSIVDGTKGGVLRFTSKVDGSTDPDNDIVERTTIDQSYGCSIRPVKY